MMKSLSLTFLVKQTNYNLLIKINKYIFMSSKLKTALIDFVFF